MGGAVEVCAGEPLQTVHFGQVFERQVRRYERRCLFEALAEHFEEQLGPCQRQRQVDQLVNSQKLSSGPLGLQPQEPFLVKHVNQLKDETRRRDEGNRGAALGSPQGR